MTTVGANKRRRLPAMAALLCALAACLAIGATSAAAEEGNSAPLRPMAEGGWRFPEITGPTAPEEYPVQLDLSPELTLRQVSEQVVAVEYVKYGTVAYTLEAIPAHDVVGASVPTTVKVTGEDVITLSVDHRAGNPAAGGAPFAYPITEGAGWEGGIYAHAFEMSEPAPPAQPPAEPETGAAPPVCVVPSLHGLPLRTAKAHLRAAHCSIGAIHLTAGTAAGKGKVAKQFRPAGTELVAGAKIAVKLGAR